MICVQDYFVCMVECGLSLGRFSVTDDLMPLFQK